MPSDPTSPDDLSPIPAIVLDARGRPIQASDPKSGSVIRTVYNFYGQPDSSAPTEPPKGDDPDEPFVIG